MRIEKTYCEQCKTEAKEIQQKSALANVASEPATSMLPYPYGQTELLQAALLHAGADLANDNKRLLIKRIKDIVIQVVHYAEEPLTINFSDHLSEQLGYDYTYLANLFSELLGISIEKYIILNKIERVKKLLQYDGLKLTQIAMLLHYKSVAHLSTQFKKVTGITPSHFKATRKKEKFA